MKRRKSAQCHIDRENRIVFTSKRLPLEPVSLERNHQVAPGNSSRTKQAVVATFFEVKTIYIIYIYIYILYILWS